MNNRLLNSRAQELLHTLLQYDRASVQLYGTELEQDIKEAENFIKSVVKDGKIPAEYTELCHQVSVYYLYYLRHEALAVEYLNLIKNSLTEKNAFYGEICNEIGHAHTIDGTYVDDNFFKEALTCPQSHVDKAFSLRYLALIAHRKNQTDEAVKLLNNAIELIQPLSHYKTPLIDLAECRHLLGVAYTRKNALDLAEDNLLMAKVLEEDFAKKINGTHFMHMITMQSLAALYIKNNKAQDAVVLLQACLEMQESYYKTQSNADIAKTHHFMGDAFSSLSMYEEAKIAYQNALDIKLKLYDTNHFLVKITRDALSATQKALELISQITQLNQSFDFNWNDFKTFKPNAERIETVEKLLAEANQFKNLPPEIKRQLGQLNYKLGTYFNHITQNPDRALIYHNFAEKLLENDEKAWVFNHLALSYQQKMAATEDPKLRKNFYSAARDNYNFIIDNYVYATAHEPDQLKIFAFTVGVKASAEYTANDLKSAQLSCRHAIECYEAMKIFDDQYARTMRRYAIMTAQLGLDFAAKNLFDKLLQYWQKNPDINNPYARQFYETYADFIVEHYPQQLSTALQYYRLATWGRDSETGASIDHKIEEVRNRISTLSEKERSKLSFHQPYTPNLSIEERGLQKSYKM